MYTQINCYVPFGAVEMYGFLKKHELTKSQSKLGEVSFWFKCPGTDRNIGLVTVKGVNGDFSELSSSLQRGIMEKIGEKPKYKLTIVGNKTSEFRSALLGFLNDIGDSYAVTGFYKNKEQNVGIKDIGTRVNNVLRTNPAVMFMETSNTPKSPHELYELSLIEKEIDRNLGC